MGTLNMNKKLILSIICILFLFPQISLAKYRSKSDIINNHSFDNTPLVITEGNSKYYAKLNTISLWNELLDNLQQGEAQIALEDALIARLRQESGNKVYDKLIDSFRLNTLQLTAQERLISLLGVIKNYQAGETLMQLIEEDLLDYPDTVHAALDAINSFVPQSYSQHSNAELSPIFEKAWQEIDNPIYLPAIAHVMAKIGAPTSLAIFNEALTDNNNSNRVEAAKQAMEDFQNPALINEFAKNLQSSPSKNVQWANGYALASIGESAATAALFDWATYADKSKVEWVKEWFEIAVHSTPEFVQFINSNLSTQKFNSPEIKQTIKKVLADVNNDN